MMLKHIDYILIGLGLITLGTGVGSLWRAVYEKRETVAFVIAVLTVLFSASYVLGRLVAAL